MKGKNHSRSQRAFVRLELVMVLATLVLMAGIDLPMLASNRYRSEQVSCFNNLRQIGHAFHLWANDHGDKNHWWVSIDDGGTYLPPTPPGYVSPPPDWALTRNNAWFQMAWISNQLG